MFEIKVAPGGNRPIYRQIIDQVRQAISSGELVLGDPLPSVRQLAEQLVVNHNTVAKAFSELVRDGVLDSQHGRGVFVAKKRSVFSAAEKKRRLNQALDVFLAEVLVLDFSPEQILDEVSNRLQQVARKE
jgi:GntR family transcriptional regulator